MTPNIGNCPDEQIAHKIYIIWISTLARLHTCRVLLVRFCLLSVSFFLATFGTATGCERKTLKSSPDGLPIFLYWAETISSSSTRSKLFSKLEKLTPSHCSRPRSSTNFSTLSWNGSRLGSLQATLALPTLLTYFTRRDFLNCVPRNCVSCVGEFRRANKNNATMVVPIANTTA